MSATIKVEVRQLPQARACPCRPIRALMPPASISGRRAGRRADDYRPGKHALVPTGLIIALPPGFEAQVRPRSGLAAKHGVTVLNAPGTVDADYRGEVGVLLINHGDAPFTIRRGERIAQMVIASVVRAELVAVIIAGGNGAWQRGFGSTGR